MTPAASSAAAAAAAAATPAASSSAAASGSGAFALLSTEEKEAKEKRERAERENAKRAAKKEADAAQLNLNAITHMLEQVYSGSQACFACQSRIRLPCLCVCCLLRCGGWSLCNCCSRQLCALARLPCWVLFVIVDVTSMRTHVCACMYVHVCVGMF